MPTPALLNSTTHAANSSSIQAPPFFSPTSNDRDLEAAATLLAATNGNYMTWSENDREAALSMALNCATTMVQIIYQRRGPSPNLASIFAIVLSLFLHFGYNHFSRASTSAARSCSSGALFASAFAVASLLAMPLRGILKCIPYALCFFPLVSFLSSLSSCVWFSMMIRGNSQPLRLEEGNRHQESGPPPPPTSSANPAATLDGGHSSMDTPLPAESEAINVTVLLAHDES